MQRQNPLEPIVRFASSYEYSTEFDKISPKAHPISAIPQFLSARRSQIRSLEPHELQRPPNMSTWTFDDSLTREHFLKDDSLRALFMNSRHFAISNVCTFQDLAEVPSFLQRQVSLVCMFKSRNRHDIQKAYALWFNYHFDSLVAFKDTLNQLSPYSCLVLKNHLYHF